MDASAVNHVYKHAGDYKVKLVLTSDKGCVSDTSVKSITIHAVKPDFIAPLTCASDATAHFSDNSTITGTDNPVFAYLWNFGDSRATGQNPPTATTANPDHRYYIPGDYDVSLTVTSDEGCTSTVTKTIRVNGVQPKADFEIVNGTGLCSGQMLVVKDKSTVADFGNIIRLEWVFDSVNQPAVKTVADTLHKDGLYYYSYPVLNIPAQKAVYRIKLLAYSGTGCVDSIAKDVTLFPTIKIKLNNPGLLCLQSAHAQITQSPETGTFSGVQGSYSGDGVSSDGVFNPSAAGLGVHHINYIFSTEGGCRDTVGVDVTVINNPAATGKTSYVLQGNSVSLAPIYSSGIITYKWVPATGLDHDDIAFPKATPTDNIVYNVTVFNGACENSAAINVIVLRPVLPFNTFTPNNDGKNDVWDIKNIEDYPNATVDIFTSITPGATPEKIVMTWLEKKAIL